MHCFTCHTLHVTFCLPERREARAREGGDFCGGPGGEDRTARRGWAGSGGGLFPLFADARPLPPSKPFSQSKC